MSTEIYQSFTGEIRLNSSNIVPDNWKICNGELLEVQYYPALFAIIGTAYGGDGHKNFALPDMQSRVALGAGHGTNLHSYAIGNKGGDEHVTLHTSQIPAHEHMVESVVNKAPFGPFRVTLEWKVSNETGDTIDPENAYLADTQDPLVKIYSSAAPDGAMKAFQYNTSGNSTTTGSTGSHNNIQPVFALNYIICVNGVHPVSAT